MRRHWKRRTAAAVFLCVVALGLPAQEGADRRGGDAAYRAALRAAEELFEVMDMQAQFDQNVELVLDVQLQQNPALAPYRDVMLEFFATYLSWDSLREEVGRMYAESFSAEEIRTITAFYRTPTGRKALELMPELSARGAELGQRRVTENIHELERMLDAAMRGR